MELQSPKNILCPVDFSETSAMGLRLAHVLAKCAGARLTVVFADQFLPPPYFTQGRLDEVKRGVATAMEKAAHSLDEFVRKELGATEIPVASRVIEALPVDGILRAAGELGADLIAMGTHGRSGFNRLMLGSVTERVLRESSIPVLTVRPGSKDWSAAGAIRNIVCPVNNTELAHRSLGYAVSLAQCLGAKLTALHVAEPGGKDGIEDLCAWIPREAHSSCEVQELTRTGDPAHEIVAAAAQFPCDLLIIGARHRRFFDATVIGTTTIRVVRHAPCAVLTVV